MAPQLVTLFGEDQTTNIIIAAAIGVAAVLILTKEGRAFVKKLTRS